VAKTWPDMSSSKLLPRVGSALIAPSDAVKDGVSGMDGGPVGTEEDAGPGATARILAPPSGRALSNARTRGGFDVGFPLVEVDPRDGIPAWARMESP